MCTVVVDRSPQARALVRNLSAFTTLFSSGKSWDNMRTTTAPYTESRLAHLVRNKCVGFPVVEQGESQFQQGYINCATLGIEVGTSNRILIF